MTWNYAVHQIEEVRKVSMLPKKGRNRGFTKRSGLILAVLLILSLGSIGSAMALWRDSLTIKETAQTGTWLPQFNEVGTTTVTPVPPAPGDADTPTTVGSIKTAEITDVDANHMRQKLYIKIENVTSGETYTVPFKIKNNGTVPFKIDIPSTLPTGVTLSPGGNDLNPNQESGYYSLIYAANSSNGAFSIALPCHQWNLPYDPAGTAWQDDLIIQVEFVFPSR